VPDSLPQLYPLAQSGKKNHRVGVVWLEQIVAAHLSALFPGMEILAAHPFHVTRDADIAIKLTICSKRSRKACASGVSAASCG
jgi:polyphosphate kinase